MEGNFLEKTTFLPNELAAAAGVSTDTLRHYERKGVLARPPRSANGYRRYAPSALERLKLIRASLSIGFTLDELARVLKEKERGGRPCEAVLEMAVGKLSEIDEQINALIDLRKRLGEVVGNWRAKMSRTSSSERARLLENLAADNGRIIGGPGGKLSPKTKRKKEIK